MSLNFTTSLFHASTTDQLKSTVNALDKLKKRILNEFPKKVLIGDIIINELEFELLIDYFRAKCGYLLKSNKLINDPVFAVALVQIGIKYYDGNLWGHIAEVLRFDKLNPNHQTRIGNSFVYTLKANDKLMLDSSERASNVLMHGFVSNHYANEMFDFLFKYYTIDLERDLHRNTTEMLNNLMEIAQRNDNTGRTHLLVKQTANALAINAKGGKIRIRRLLRLIDKCFWEQIKPMNPVSRLSVLFNQWTESSMEFQQHYQKFHFSLKTRGGKKRFSTPYLSCDFSQTRFKLVLPSQWIKFDYEQGVYWLIRIGNDITKIPVALYPAVTGNKTEEQAITLSEDNLFNEINIELISEDTRLRLFKIKKDCIRFFDKNGDYIYSSSHLPKGEMYSFTPKNETPRSEALVENTPIKNLICSFFEFEIGDIVRLPDGNAISIGKQIEEGLQQRKRVDGVQAIMEHSSIPVYTGTPTILLKIAAKRANGTMIEVNHVRHRLFDQEVTVIELQDRSEETGYLLNLTEFGCNENGIYHIHIDVPNDRTNRNWSFALVNQMNFEFEDAPYIFQTKGTIRFPESLVINARRTEMKKNSDQNSFNFFLYPDVDELQFVCPTPKEDIVLGFDIPVFKWKFDKGTWHIEKPADIWHSDIPTMIYMKYPVDKIKLSLDEPLQDDSLDDELAIIATKSKSKSILECDLTRFKSWLGKEKVLRIGYLEFQNHRIEFLRIITRSVVVSVLLKGDFEWNVLSGDVDIVGKSNYYADIEMLETNERLADKLLVVDGKFDLSVPIGSGNYKIILFEDEEDDTGFGTASYLQLGEFVQKLTNPLDLQDKNLVIKSIKKGQESIFQMGLSCSYRISNLRRISPDDRHSYKGKMLIVTPNRPSPIAFDVKVWFPDLSKLQYASITFFDGYDDVEFLYDSHRRFIVKVEEKGLSRAVRYRRYECLFPEEYVFFVGFED